MTEQDHRTIEAMIRWGGSFVRHLGEAARHADPQNLERLKHAWPEYWERYSLMSDALVKS